MEHNNENHYSNQAQLKKQKTSVISHNSFNDRISTERWKQIFSFFNKDDLAKTARVNKFFKDIIYANEKELLNQAPFPQRDYRLIQSTFDYNDTLLAPVEDIFFIKNNIYFAQEKKLMVLNYVSREQLCLASFEEPISKLHKLSEDLISIVTFKAIYTWNIEQNKIIKSSQIASGLRYHHLTLSNGNFLLEYQENNILHYIIYDPNNHKQVCELNFDSFEGNSAINYLDYVKELPNEKIIGSFISTLDLPLPFGIWNITTGEYSAIDNDSFYQNNFIPASKYKSDSDLDDEPPQGPFYYLEEVEILANGDILLVFQDDDSNFAANEIWDRTSYKINFRPSDNIPAKIYNCGKLKLLSNGDIVSFIEAENEDNYDSYLCIWDRKSGNIRYKSPMPCNHNFLDVLPNSTLDIIAVTKTKEVFKLNSSIGEIKFIKELQLTDDCEFISMTILPDRNIMITTGTHGIRVAEIDTGKLLMKEEPFDAGIKNIYNQEIKIYPNYIRIFGNGDFLATYGEYKAIEPHIMHETCFTRIFHFASLKPYSDYEVLLKACIKEACKNKALKDNPCFDSPTVFSYIYDKVKIEFSEFFMSLPYPSNIQYLGDYVDKYRDEILDFIQSDNNTFSYR